MYALNFVSENESEGAMKIGRFQSLNCFAKAWVVFAIILAQGRQAIAQHEYQACTDPALGPRACDWEYEGCENVRLPSGYVMPMHADYTSSFPEASQYLGNLDTPYYDPDGYLALMELGDVPEMDIFDATGSGDWENFAYTTGRVVAARITDGAEDPEIDKPKILMVAGIHSNEWIAQEVCLGYIDWLVQSANDNPGYGNDHEKVAEMLKRRSG
jgi:hypothetical protein